jgi:hypothetical protein
MNYAIWLGAEKRLPLDPEVAPTVIDCDATKVPNKDADGPMEDLNANRGLLLFDGATVWRLRLTGENVKLFELPEPISATQSIEDRRAQGHFYGYRVPRAWSMRLA